MNENPDGYSKEIDRSADYDANEEPDIDEENIWSLIFHFAKTIHGKVSDAARN